jgi:acetyl esterase/lipase
MIKTILFVVIACIFGLGLWFNSWSGPQKLEFADRYYWGAADQPAVKTAAIAYGDDPRQKLDVFAPVNKGNHRVPVLVFFHGGSWRDGERDGYGFLGRAFAARGFVTIVADYRKIKQVRFPEFVNDAAAAIAWAHRNSARYNGDPDNLFIMGHSAGAHLALLAALDTRYLAKTGLQPNAVKGVIGLAGPYDFLPFTTDAAKYAFGTWPKPAETQPITYARGDAPPMLLLTGDADDTVKPRNSKVLAAAIADVEGVAELKIYPTLGHLDIIMAVARPFRSKAPVITDVVDFIGRNSRNP